MQSKETGNPWEYLHGAPNASRDPNRCLVIPSNSISKSKPTYFGNENRSYNYVKCVF